MHSDRWMLHLTRPSSLNTRRAFLSRVVCPHCCVYRGPPPVTGFAPLRALNYPRSSVLVSMLSPKALPLQPVILQQSEGFAFLHSPTCIRGSTCIVCGFTCSWSVCCQHAAGGLFHKGQSPGTGEHLTCPRPSVDRVDCLHPIHRVEILGRQAFDTTILCQRTWV